MNIFHSIGKNTNNLEKVVTQDFGLIDEVSSWMNDLEAPKTIKGKMYQMLLPIYPRDELDKINDWVESIQAGNKVILSQYDDIQEMQTRVWTHIFEADNYYNATNLEIFKNDSKDQLSTTETVVQQFKASFEAEASKEYSRLNK